MIPQSRIPTTPHHPPGPNPPECFPLSVLSPTPSHPKKSRKHLKASKFGPSPRPYPIFSSLRNFYSFPVPPGFFQKLPLSPLPRPNILFPVFSPKTDTAFRSRPCARTGAEPLAVPHGSSFFRSPHPPDRRRTVNGPFCVPGSRLLSVYSSPPPECRPFCPLFALKTPRLPRPHLAVCQSSPSLSHRLETVSFFSKIAAFSFFSGKTTKNLADSIEFFYSKFFQKVMLSPDNSWKSVAFSV